MRESASVVMAAYNGEKWIESQIRSILDQMHPQDELIISLDPSTDRTEEIIQSFHSNQLLLVRGPGKGVQANFENGLRHVRNPIVFLSDQDDVWLPGKMERMIDVLSNPSITCVVHDCAMVNASLEVEEPSFFRFHGTKAGAFHNFVRNSFIGCCMVFRTRCLETILPFPAQIPMHDQWIGLICARLGNVVWLDEVYLFYRRHGENVTSMKSSSFLQQIRWRAQLGLCLLKRK